MYQQGGGHLKLIKVGFGKGSVGDCSGSYLAHWVV